jgi:hypothetical protein
LLRCVRQLMAYTLHVRCAAAIASGYTGPPQQAGARAPSFSGTQLPIFALQEFERDLIRERTIAGLASARARGRNGGRPFTMTPAKLRLAQAAMAKRDTKVGDLCKELGVTRQTLYRFVGPKGELRADATRLLKRNGQERTKP